MPYALLIAAAVIWIIAAIKPVNRGAWLLENILLFVGVGWLAFTFKTWRLSDTSYELIFVYLVLHVIGAHYTYSRTPGGNFLGRIFGSNRNSYDRVVHFSFGLLLFYPWRETALLSMGVSPAQGSLIAVLIIGAVSAIYEIVEWGAALIVNPPDAIDYIGAQGDFFDAQKDMACAFAGALIALGGVELTK